MVIGLFPLSVFAADSDAVNGKAADNTRWVADVPWIGLQDGFYITQFNDNFMCI